MQLLLYPCVLLEPSLLTTFSIAWFDTRLTLQTMTLESLPSIYYCHVTYLQFCHLLKKQSNKFSLEVMQNTEFGKHIRLINILFDFLSEE